MKNKSIIIITAVLLLLALASCDSLIAPMKERLNPVDPEATIARPRDVHVEAGYDNDIFGVLYSFQFDSQENDKTSGFIVVRKVREVPESVNDGELVAAFLNDTGAADIQHFENIQDNPEYEKGYKIYYAVFAYAEKYDENEMDEDEKIYVDENNLLRNTHNYNFIGPAYEWVPIWASIDLPVADDDYLTTAGFWGENITPGSEELIIESDTSIPQVKSYITFNLDDRPAYQSNIELAQLVLTKRTSSIETDMDIDLLNMEWPGETWTNLNDPGTVDYDYNVTELVPGGDSDEMYVDLTNMYNAWVDGEKNNYGIQLSWMTTTMETAAFHSNDSSSVDARPKLRVWYWND